MTSLLTTIATLWGRRSADVAHAYRAAFAGRPLLEADLAIFCNAGAPITGASEFDRGVEEGKRRVWLHIARMRGLPKTSFRLPMENGFDHDRHRSAGCGCRRLDERLHR